MKKRIVIPIIIIVLLALVISVVWFMPKSFGKNVSPEQVHHINVFDGSTGTGFTISEPDDIKYIVENIQSVPMKKTGVSLGYMGYGLKISYIDENDKDVIPLFIVNSDDTIRKDPFFYRCDGGLCFDYIKALEPDLSSEEQIETVSEADPTGERMAICIDDVYYYNTEIEVPVEPDESAIEYVEIPVDGDATVKAFARIQDDHGAYLVCLIDNEWYKFIAE